MKKLGYVMFCLMLGILVIGNVAFAQEDEPECKDHPLFSRLPGYYIGGCEEKEFDTHTFYDPSTKQEVIVEGRLYEIHYYIQEALEGEKSQIQVTRNYVNAITKIGGTGYEYNSAKTYMKLVKDDKEIWAHIDQDNWGGNIYYLFIVEKQAMTQEVVADAKSMAQDISVSGRVALYGIYFDFDKAEVKPESDPTLKEIAKLLSQDSNLKLYVVGHTDDVGDFNYNLKLSQARADAVVQTLVSKYGVDGNRLTSHGVGPLSPVTSNKTEDGRAKNRRVELVEQ